MFGLMTKRAHRAKVAELEADIEACISVNRQLTESNNLQYRALQRLRPMADKWQAHLDRAKTNFSKGRK